MSEVGVGPIKITAKGYWDELLKLHEQGFPLGVISLVRSLVNCITQGTIPPRAAEGEIVLAKEYLSGGIEIDGRLFEIAVFKPKDPIKNRHFFVLRQCYPEGILLPLDQFAF
jgi:hypothetical protein